MMVDPAPVAAERPVENDQPDHVEATPVFTLETSKSGLRWAIGLCGSMGLLAASVLIFIVVNTTEIRQPMLPALGLAVFSLAFGSFFGVVAFQLRLKLRSPDILEFFPKGFRYRNQTGGKEFSAAWRDVGEPKLRASGKTYVLEVEIAGTKQTIFGGAWGVSVATKLGLVNSARTGKVITPAEWLRDHPEPDERKEAIKGIKYGLLGTAGLFLVIAIFMFLARR